MFHRLKKSLTEALSQRSTGPTQPFDTDTPADKTMKLLTAILHGEQVDAGEGYCACGIRCYVHCHSIPPACGPACSTLTHRGCPCVDLPQLLSR